MSDTLLPYYDRELDAIKRLAAEFADAHPKIAGRLRLSADAVDDPHVARLLEGVAFLAARVHHRLDDEFPELTDALLGLLYPHYLAPMPSCMVAQFDCQPDLMNPARLAAGIAIDTEPVRGEELPLPHHVRRSTLWPVEVENVRLSGLPLVAPANPPAAGAAGVLRITLKCASPEATFAQLGVDRLRFFLRGADQPGAGAVRTARAPTRISVAYADSAVDPAPVIVPASAIEPVGFSPDEALLPWSARGFSGFRLLTEYFAFPEKFLFLDFTRMDSQDPGVRRQPAGDLRLSRPRRCRNWSAPIGQQSLALGCTPLVNLFPAALRADHAHPPGDRIPHRARRPPAARPRRSGASSGCARPCRTASFRPWRPFHRLTEGDPEAGMPGGFYHVARRAAAPGVPGTEVFLAPHDPDFDPDRPAEAVLSIDALCVNRDLPTDLPFGGGHPRLRLVEGAAAVAALNARHRRHARPCARRCARPASGAWCRICRSGHLSVTGGAEGAAALKEVLRLYDLRDTAETRAAIEALIGITAGPGTARAPGPRRRLLPRAGRHTGIRSAQPGRPAASICSPRCWSTSLRCTGRSTASPAPRVDCCAAAPAPPPPGRPAAAPACCA